MADANAPFWKVKTFSQMTEAEWESLCDGCGLCCMHKLQDEESGQIYMTGVACRLLDAWSCRCSDYQNRQTLVPDCLKLTEKIVSAVQWLPPTCAYRKIAEGKELDWWHPLIAGNDQAIHRAGISVRGKVAVREDELACEDDYLSYILD